MSESAPMTLTVRVTPRARLDAVVGWRSDARDELDIRVTAPPEHGKANAAVVRTLARALDIPKSGVEVVRGHTSRVKVVAFEMDVQGYQRWREALPVRH